MIDFFKFRELQEEHGAGDEGTPSLVAKYKAATPGQTSSAPARQPARKGDKLNAKMDYSKKIKQDDITVKNTMSEEAEVDEAVKHDRYLRSHGKKASGTGQWMFTTKPMGSVDYKNPKEVYAAKHSMKMSDAAKEAQKALGSKDVYVMEAFEDPEAQKSEMALTKLHFVKYAADEIRQYIEMGAPIEEWYQIKLAKVHADMEGLHSYMEGEKRRTGMTTESVNEGENKQMKGKDPCWKGYQMVGMKKKNGKEVPNCVPKESVEEDYDLEEMAGANMSTRELHAYLKKLGWEHARSSGSHDVYKHPNSPENIAVPKHKKIKPPTILGILKQAKKVKNSMVEKLDPSMGAGEYVKDFQKSDAPQFKGKSKKERQDMAVAAYLSAKRGD